MLLLLLMVVWVAPCRARLEPPTDAVTQSAAGQRDRTVTLCAAALLRECCPNATGLVLVDGEGAGWLEPWLAARAAALPGVPVVVQGAASTFPKWAGAYVKPTDVVMFAHKYQGSHGLWKELRQRHDAFQAQIATPTVLWVDKLPWSPHFIGTAETRGLIYTQLRVAALSPGGTVTVHELDFSTTPPYSWVRLSVVGTYRSDTGLSPPGEVFPVFGSCRRKVPAVASIYYMNNHPRIAFATQVVERAARMAGVSYSFANTSAPTKVGAGWPADVLLSCRQELLIGHVLLFPFFGTGLQVHAQGFRHHLIVLVPPGIGYSDQEWWKLYREFSPCLWLLTVTAAVSVAVVYLASLTSNQRWLSAAHLSLILDVLPEGWFNWRPGLLPAVRFETPAKGTKEGFWTWSWEAARLGLGSLLNVPLASRPGASSQRALVASWLVSCVVMSAAYQGQLLSSLTTDNRPHISSLKELVALANSSRITLKGSGFSVFVLRQDEASDRALGPAVDAIQEISGAEAIVEQVQQLVLCTSGSHPPAVALIVGPNSLARIKEAVPDFAQRLHVLKIPLPFMDVMVMAMEGSRFDLPVRRLQGRMHAAGITDKYFRDEPESVTDSFKPARSGISRALTLSDMQPAFYVLGAVYLLATAALMAELVLPRPRVESLKAGGGNAVVIARGADNVLVFTGILYPEEQRRGNGAQEDSNLR